MDIVSVLLRFYRSTVKGRAICNIYFFKKKRIEVDGQVIKEGTTFYGKNIFSNDRIRDEKQFFKTNDAYIPCGLIIRILRRRQSFDELEER